MAIQDTKAQDKIRGVFSSQKVTKIGTGTTTRKTIQRTLFFASQNEEGVIEIQPLNQNFVPSGKGTPISKEELLRRYTPELEFYVSTVQPKLKQMYESLERGDKHRESGELYSASFEYAEIIRLDESNVRANFGIGLCYLERGEIAKAEDILRRIVKLEAAFEPQHKHLFNEFGISLRRAGLFDQAIEYYTRALDFTKEDDHLYYNLARAYKEKGDLPSALKSIEKCLSIDPALEPAQRLRDALQAAVKTAA